MSVLDGMELPDPGALEYPRQVALLLPLSGRNGAAGKAVQNGFFGAYYGASAGLADVQEVRVYDVVELGGAREAYANSSSARYCGRLSTTWPAKRSCRCRC